MQPNGRTIIIIKIVRSSSSRYHIVGRDERPFSRISRHLTPSLFPLSLLLILSLFLFISYIENAHTFQLTRQSLMLQNACILFSIFILYCTLTVRPTNVFEAQNYQYDGSLVEFVALQFVKLIFFFKFEKLIEARLVAHVIPEYFSAAWVTRFYHLYRIRRPGEIMKLRWYLVPSMLVVNRNFGDQQCDSHSHRPPRRSNKVSDN